MSSLKQLILSVVERGYSLDEIAKHAGEIRDDMIVEKLADGYTTRSIIEDTRIGVARTRVYVVRKRAMLDGRL